MQTEISSAIMMVVLGGQGQGQGRQARFQLMPTSRINLKTFFGGVVVWGFCGGVDTSLRPPSWREASRGFKLGSAESFKFKFSFRKFLP